MARRAFPLIVAGLAVLIGACRSGSNGISAPTTIATVTTTTTGVELEPITIEWADTSEVVLPNGWTIRDCDGDRPHVCVYEGAEFLGDIELLAGYPLDSDDDATKPRAVALEWARRMIDDFRVDRASGCADFTFTPLEVTETIVGGRPGARGGFTLTDGGGVVEHVINHYVLVDGRMTIINTDAYATTGGCLPPAEESPSFTPEHLAELDDGILDRIAAGSPVRPADQAHRRRGNAMTTAN